jgi:hypothetical protein
VDIIGAQMHGGYEYIPPVRDFEHLRGMVFQRADEKDLARLDDVRPAGDCEHAAAFLDEDHLVLRMMMDSEGNLLEALVVIGVRGFPGADAVCLRSRIHISTAFSCFAGNRMPGPFSYTIHFIPFIPYSLSAVKKQDGIFC